jgi:CRP-like cAMP-binding protein
VIIAWNKVRILFLSQRWEGKMQSMTNGFSQGQEAQKKKRTATELFDLIKQSVAAGKIKRAELLREELMRIGSIPLSQIIAAADLIETARLAGIDDKHQLLWIDLYDCLTPEEKSLFFYSLDETIIPAKTIFLKQGHANDGLYFVEEGHVNAIFTKEKKNNLVLQIGKGGFFGEDNFFGMSVCTSSFVSRSALKVKILNRDKTATWGEDCPGLFAKLEAYCCKFGHYEELFERIRCEKSRFDRLSVNGKVFAAVLGRNMEQTGKKFKATVADISRGGACFYIKASRNEVARNLLAKPLEMIFAIKTTTKIKKISAFGRVVRVKYHLENDYSVHVKFAKTLGRDTLGEILAK